MVKRIAHVSLAVKNLDKAIQLYRDVLGCRIGKRETVADQKVEVAFLETGETKLELVAPTSDDSPVARFIEKRGQGVHHICLVVDDLSGTIEHLIDHGITMIDEQPRTGADGKSIAFIHPKSMNGALIELSSE